MIDGFAFHHLGLATRHPDRAAAFVTTLGYALDAPVWDPLQQVHVRLGHHPSMPTVELVWPGDGPSPIDGVLERAGAGPYHLCWEVDDLDAAADALGDAGHRIFPVTEPTPAVLFGGRRVWFLTVHGFGLVELLER